MVKGCTKLENIQGEVHLDIFFFPLGFKMCSLDGPPLYVNLMYLFGILRPCLDSLRQPPQKKIIYLSLEKFHICAFYTDCIVFGFYYFVSF